MRGTAARIHHSILLTITLTQHSALNIHNSTLMLHSEFLQFFITGITVGFTYALIAIGFSIIYNASDVVNFAQGEFVMIGALSTISLHARGIPLPLAILGGVAITAIAGIALEKLAVEKARESSVITTAIITIGASIFFRGLAMVIWGKDIYQMPHFSGETPLNIFGATALPQHLWVIGGAITLMLFFWYFFNRTLFGKAMRACSYNKTAASLVGIRVNTILVSAYAISAALGAISGVLIAPISYMTYESGTMLGLKGFAAAILGGMGSASGAVLGGLCLGLLESFSAGFISSSYKDAVTFIVILLVLFFRPSGILGKKEAERV